MGFFFSFISTSFSDGWKKVGDVALIGWLVVLRGGGVLHFLLFTGILGKKKDELIP